MANLPKHDTQTNRTIVLDFNGGNHVYRNPELGLNIPAQIEPSGISADRARMLAKALNRNYADSHVRFEVGATSSENVSAVHIGRTDAFDTFGRFLGLAEGIGSGDAFVLLDDSSSDAELAAVIRHEAGHILGTLDHGGAGLARYAAYTYYYIQNNCTVTDLFYPGEFQPEVSYFYLVHYSSNREYLSSNWSKRTSYCCVSSRYDKAADETVSYREYLIVNNGCSTSNVKVIGGMDVYLGGSSDETTIYSGGSVMLNGIAKNTIIDSNGLLSVQSGGIANNTTINSHGMLRISRGGAANNTIVNKLAYVYISSGGTATAVRENGGYVHVFPGAYATFVPHSFSGLVLSGYQSASLHSATSAFNASILSNAKIDVCGGMAISTTVKSCAFLHVWDGGAANDTTLGYAGYLYISSAGTANNTQVSGGSMFVSDGGTANDTQVNRGGMFVSDGGTANDTTVNGGGMLIFSGGIANSATFKGGGCCIVSSGGTANSATVNVGGSFYVSSGGTANSTTVNSGASFHVPGGGTATMIKENGGWVSVNAEAKVTFVSNSFSGLKLSNTSASVHYYTVANNTTINNRGCMVVFNSGKANDTTVNVGGRLCVSSGGTASNTTVASEGSFFISSGGMATGQMMFYDGATVSAGPGSIIDFDISEIAPGSAARVNNLSVVSGRNAANYTITVSGTQAKGEYVLAEGASDFNQTISVVNTSGKVLGVLTGQPTLIGDTYYMLKRRGDVLSVKIGAEKTAVNYEFTDIGQTVYYDGPAPEGSTLTGTLMVIPYTADITISFDKELDEGLYEFTTSVAEVPGAVNDFKIQILEGIPGIGGEDNLWSVEYVSNNACYYGTKIGETDTTVTYKFMNVSDHLLIDSIPESEISLITDCGNADGMISLSLNEKEVIYNASSDLPDVNKSYFVTGFRIKRENEENSEIPITVKSSPDYKNNSFVYSADWLINNEIYSDLKTDVEWTNNNQEMNIVIRSNEDLNYSFSIAATYSKDKGTLTITSISSAPKDTVPWTYSFDKEGLKQDSAPWDKNHCWVAVACNMLKAGGYLSIDAYDCFDILNEIYYLKDNGSRGGNPSRVFYDLICKALDIKKTDKECWSKFASSRISEGLQHIESTKGAVGALGLGEMNRHVITVYSVKMNSQKTSCEITCADSDTDVNTNVLVGMTLKKEGDNWYLNGGGYANRIVDSLITLLPNNSGKTISKSDIGNYQDLSGYIPAHFYAQECNGINVEDGHISVSGNVYNSIIMEDAVLTVASGAEAEEMVVHTGGAVKFNSGSIAKGKIRTAGGTLTVESGVDVSEAEFDFAVSYMEGGTGARLLNDLHNVSGTKLTITIVNGQSAGKYVLAGGAANFNGTLPVVGIIDCLEDIEEGFEDGFIGELGLDNTLCIEDRIYSLTLKGDDLVLMISSEVISGFVVTSSDTIIVSSGDVYAEAIVSSGGSMCVNSDGRVKKTTVDSNGNLHVSDGGIANHTSVSGGSMILSGGVANFITVSGGSMILSGGTANNTTMQAGDIQVGSGGTLNATTVDSNGNLHVSSGGIANYIMLQSFGMLYVSGGIANDVTINARCSMIVSSGGITNDTTVSGGSMVLSGGTANYNTVSGGSMTVSSGGIANYNTISDGSMFVSNGGTANSTTMQAGGIRVGSGGTLNATTVSKGYLHVSTGGIANDTMVSGGCMTIYSGGIALDTTISSGELCVFSGGVAKDIAIIDGALDVSSGGTATNVAWTPCEGRITVLDGGYVTYASQYSGVYYGSDGHLLSNAMEMNNLTVDQVRTMFVMSGGTATNLTVSSGNLVISSGGTAANITVSSGASITVFSDGAANGISLSAGGRVFVSGGTAMIEEWTPFEGQVHVLSGGQVLFSSRNVGVYYGSARQLLSSAVVMSGTSIGRKQTMYVLFLGKANGITVSSGGSLAIFSGGTASNALGLGGCYTEVYSGGSLVSAQYSGSLHIYSGGFANIITLNDGSLCVSSGGTANATTLNGGSMEISSGGVASHVKVISGSLYVRNGASASNVNVSSGGGLGIDSGAAANDITLSGGSVMVSSGGMASCTTVSSGGSLIIFSGGMASRTTVSSGGSMMVSSGGTADNIAISNGGSLTISSGGTLTGQMTIASSAVVSVFSGSVIDFDISNIGPGAGARINSLSLISGWSNADFTLTVDAETQYFGSYILAGSASSFNRTISVLSTTGEMLGTLSVGKTANIGGVDYKLIRNGSTLSVMAGSSSGAGSSYSGELTSSRTISAGMVAIKVHVLSGGRMIISAGGSAIDTTVDSLCRMTVFSGGTASGTTVISRGEVLLSGGVAINTVINHSSSCLKVFSGGTANETSIFSNGHMIVSSGGAADNTTVNDGDLSISPGGTANNTTVNGGTLHVSSGGIANNVNVNSGSLRVWFDAAANNILVSSGGGLSILSGGVANNITLSSGGALYVASGATATNIVWSPFEGQLHVSDGGHVTIANADDFSGVYHGSGSLLFSSAMAMEKLTLGMHCSVYVMSGGTVNDIIISSYGVLFVSSGGAACDTTVSSGGSLAVFSGGSANNNTVDPGGWMYVSGGTAENTTVLSGGNLFVSSGGTATNIVWTPCLGTVSVFEGGYATYASQYSGVYYGGRASLLSSAAEMNGMTISGLKMYVMSDGVTNDTTVLSGGDLYVSSGGTANGNTVGLSGRMHVIGGTAERTTVLSGGSLSVSSGGTANSNTVGSGGRMHVIGGTAERTTVLSGGSLFVSSGGIVDDTTVNTGSLYVLSGGTANYTALQAGKLLVSSGGTANDTTVNTGSLYVLSGGTAERTTVLSGGSLYVSSGGIADGVVISAGGSLTVSHGGTATSIVWTPCEGKLIVSDGGYMTFASQYSGVYYGSGGQLLSSAMEMNSMSIGSDCEMYVMSGGAADTAEAISRGCLTVFSGGTAESTTVLRGGCLTVSHGGTADRALLSDGRMTIFSGGIANNTTLNDLNALLLLFSGSVANDTTVNSGRVFVYGHASANRTTLESFGCMSVENGGTANSTTLLNGGSMTVSSGTIRDTTINDDSKLYVCRGGTASNTIVSSGAVFNISSGGKLTGQTIIESGAVIIIESDAILDFDISELAPDAAVRINDLSRVAFLTGTVFTLTVSDSQVDGIYKLAESASRFYETIVVQNTLGETFGILRAGRSITVGDVNYTLNLGNDGLLSVKVTSPDTVAPVMVSATATPAQLTNQNVTFTATFMDNVAVASVQYRLGSFGEWLDFSGSVTVTDNTTIHLKATDTSGNESNYEYEIKNIDKTPPGIEFSGDNSTPLQMSTLTASTEEGLDIFFSTDSSDNPVWTKYTGKLDVAANATYYFMTTDAAGNIGTAEYDFMNIDTTAPEIALSGDNQTPLQSSTLTAAVDDDSEIFYSLDETTWTKYELPLTITANATYYFRATDAAGNTGTNFLTFANIIQAPVSEIAPQSQTWEKTVDDTKYIVEISTDDGHAIQLVVDSNSLDSFQMPAGSYQMRVKPEGGEWTVLEPVVAPEANTEPKLVKSNEDGNADIFFANSNGTWKSGCIAQHVGSIGDWEGTNEFAALFGKNKLADIIEGSTDANILLMTDGPKGDALFVDDIFTASPGSIAEKQSRIAQIDEIRAGFGNDVVDMTSQRFEYIGDGLTIRGGDGNDTIWANKGDNKLFGDAGNDRIVGASGNDIIAGGIGNDRLHGGGGDDVFTFCDNWGVDTVEQLATGSVTLWFASGSIENWDAETLTYSDDANSVTVKGVADKITLKFGDDGSDQFAALSGMGAFFDATTERIFEESGKGILASL